MTIAGMLDSFSVQGPGPIGRKHLGENISGATVGEATHSIFITASRPLGRATH